MNNTLVDLQRALTDMLSDIDNFCTSNKIDYFMAYGSALGAVRHSGFIPWDDDIDLAMTEENYTKFLTLFKNTEKYTLQVERSDTPMTFSKVRMNNTTYLENIVYRKKYKKMHQGIFIDIFCLDKVPLEEKKIRRQYMFFRILKLQSLFLRGKQDWTLKQRLAVKGSMILFPFNTKMRKYCKSFNKDNLHRYTDNILNRSIIFKEETLFPVKRIQFNGKLLPVPNDCDMYLRQIYGDYMTLPSEEKRKARIHAKLFLLEDDYKNHI